jgi:3-dehydroquinate dehydratase
MTPKETIYKEQIENSYEFKLIKRILKQEFPWIIDVELQNLGLAIYTTIQVHLIINPYKLQQETGWHFKTKFLYDIEDRTVVDQVLNNIYQISFNEGIDIIKKIEKIMNSIHTSPALPEELKVPERYLKWTVNHLIFPNETTK